jgi:hypothetical protein
MCAVAIARSYRRAPSAPVPRPALCLNVGVRLRGSVTPRDTHSIADSPACIGARLSTILFLPCARSLRLRGSVTPRDTRRIADSPACIGARQSKKHRCARCENPWRSRRYLLFCTKNLFQIFLNYIAPQKNYLIHAPTLRYAMTLGYGSAAPSLRVTLTALPLDWHL